MRHLWSFMWLILKIEIYCVKEKRKPRCVPRSEEIIKAKSNCRLMIRSVCSNCGITKHYIIKSNTKGCLLYLHFVIVKLPLPKGGFTLPSVKCTAPYNPLDQQLYENDLDKNHIIKYMLLLWNIISALGTTITKSEKTCDKQMLDSLSQTKTKDIRESFDKSLGQAAIGTKLNLVLEQKTTRHGVVEKRTGNRTSQASKKFPRRRVISNGNDQIWCADLVEMQKISKWNKGFVFVLW